MKSFGIVKHDGQCPSLTAVETMNKIGKILMPIAFLVKGDTVLTVGIALDTEHAMTVIKSPLFDHENPPEDYEEYHVVSYYDHVKQQDLHGVKMDDKIIQVVPTSEQKQAIQSILEQQK